MSFLNFFIIKLNFFFMNRYFETTKFIDNIKKHKNVIIFSRFANIYYLLILIILILTFLTFNFYLNAILNLIELNPNYFYPTHNSFYEQIISYFNWISTWNLLSNSENWLNNEELIILILLITDNFFTYEDYLLILSELNDLETLLNFQYFTEFKLKKILSNDQSMALLNEYLRLRKLFDSNLYFKELNLFSKPFGPKFVINADLTTEEAIFKNFAWNFAIQHEFYSKKENIFKQFVYNFFLNYKNELDAINWIIIRILTDEFHAEIFKTFISTQLLLLDLTILFLKKKVLLFFFLNFFIFCLMLWNLIRLCTAINLIFSLLHFLFFAVLSGLLLIFWGATYIGFCVLLIYGAAIPVLALYIIMLVNVDLIQWLFFVEHVSNKIFFRKFKKFLFLFLSIFLLITSALNYENFFLNTDNSMSNIYWTVFYFLLAKWYFNTLNVTYSVDSVYDLPLTFYSSDLDKVASAAYKISYNELIALVFLLLIAIIVVISISWTSKKLDKDFYETTSIDTDIFIKFVDFWIKRTFMQTKRAWLVHNFFWIQSLKNFYANYLNSNEFFLYKPYWDAKVTDFNAGKQKDIRYFMISPYSEWYNLYGHWRFTSFLFKNEAFIHPLPYGTQNTHPDDYFFWVVHYGLIN